MATKIFQSKNLYSSLENGNPYSRQEMRQLNQQWAKVFDL